MLLVKDFKMSKGIKRKCEQVSVEDKYNTIMKIEKGSAKQWFIAVELGVKPNTISGCIIKIHSFILYFNN